VVYRPARQISAHAERCLNTLVVAGKVSERVIAHTLIEELCSFVPGAHFQVDVEYARYEGAFLEPLEELATDTFASIRRSHGEQVQVRVIVAVAHDRKPGDFRAAACDEHVDIGSANTRCDSRRGPTPSETVFN
jgi:hypothetical protein